ncbi:hypothetical protein GCM10025857_36490 [Alicyclobacillus contaminans]|nr:hypothetical protein GCM10025857_36490 [Alicyclobacillus contaminans]
MSAKRVATANADGREFVPPKSVASNVRVRERQMRFETASRQPDLRSIEARYRGAAELAAPFALAG